MNTMFWIMGAFFLLDIFIANWNIKFLSQLNGVLDWMKEKYNDVSKLKNGEYLTVKIEDSFNMISGWGTETASFIVPGIMIAEAITLGILFFAISEPIGTIAINIFSIIQAGVLTSTIIMVIRISKTMQITRGINLEVSTLQDMNKEDDRKDNNARDEKSN